MMRLISKLPSVAPLCFFLISVAYKLAWTAISSLLSQYSKAYGPGILLQLNVAYFFPSIPVLMLQAVFNDRMDRRLGLPGGALLRFSLGLGGLVALTRYFPALTAGSEQALLVTTVLVGMSYGIAFGTSYQIASKYAAGATVALTTGFVSSGPVVLLLDLALKRGPYYSPEGLERLFQWVAVITAAGLAAAAALVLGSWRMLSAGPPHRVELKVPYKAPSYGSSVGGKDGGSGHGSDRAGGPYVRHRGEQGGGQYDGGALTPYGSGSFGQNANGYHNHHNYNGYSTAGGGGGFGAAGRSHHAITLDFSGAANDHHNHHNGHDGFSNHHNHHHGGGASHSMFHMSASADGGQADQSVDESKVSKRDLPLFRLAARILPAALSITLSVGTSMLIFPFFTYMTSTGLLGERLPQVLFYIRLVGDIAGRLVPRRLQATTVRKLMFWAFVKLAMVPLLFGCIFTPELLGGDVTSCVVVALFWVLSGYLNTCSYLVAPTLVPPSQKSRASGLMTVAFQSACFGALMLAYAVQQLEVSALVKQVAAAAGASPH
ncbi:hypothetical protein PLESTB_000649700 [Pleodorina starrii]|uniref:Uncharacterized protein n=1 Tax=Pleodorina starrii TaxID=330485 RepID=A0A9W6F0X8_9CHLO|nr:hypothetical protein PLESTB_000649700 [Pleodorina starrii]GLC71624.1 hypothetical protein PLESTF_001142400 [Pleodorina starrii]